MEEKFNLEFNLAELQIVLRGCGKLPFEESNPVIQNILQQFEAIKKKREEEGKKKSAK